MQLFDVVKYKENEVRHKALPLTEIDKLFNAQQYEITSNNGIQTAIKVFKFQFYTSMRIGDVIPLKWSNIQNRSIVYRMRKTNQDHIIPITEPLAEILISLLPKEFKRFFKIKFDEPTDVLKYLSKLNFTSISNKFIFPLLDEDTDINTMEGYKSIISKTSLVNKNLKKCGKVLGMRISSHTARHSIASAMLHSGNVDLMTIKQLLNHSSLSITEKYLSSLTQEQYENNVTDFINKL